MNPALAVVGVVLSLAFAGALLALTAACERRLELRPVPVQVEQPDPQQLAA
jgi:hypothetical protein